MALPPVSLLLCLVNRCAWAAVAKCHRLGRLKQRHLLSQSWRLEARSKVLAGWVSCEALAYRQAPPPSSHHLPSVSLCPNFLYGNLRLPVRATLMTSFMAVTSVKTLSPSVWEFGEGLRTTMGTSQTGSSDKKSAYGTGVQI